MGDTYRDPVDHLRTTRPLAGESLIDVLHWPGYLLIVAGLIGGVASLSAFGTGHSSEGMIAGVVGISAAAIGVIWLTVEHRRIRRIADRWYAEHPEVRRQRLASQGPQQLRPKPTELSAENPPRKGFTGGGEWV